MVTVTGWGAVPKHCVENHLPRVFRETLKRKIIPMCPPQTPWWMAPPEKMGATDLFHTKSQWRPWLSSRTCHKKNTFGESCPPEISLTQKKLGGCYFRLANPWFAKPPFEGWFFNLPFSSNSTPFRNPTIDHWSWWLKATHTFDLTFWSSQNGIFFGLRVGLQQQLFGGDTKTQVFISNVHEKPKCSGRKSRIQLQKIHMWQMSWSNAPVAKKTPSTGIPWVAENRNLQILKSSI